MQTERDSDGRPGARDASSPPRHCSGNVLSGAADPSLRLGAMLALIQQGPAFVWESDCRGALLHLSPAAKTTTGLTALSGSSVEWMAFIHSEDRNQVHTAWRAACDGGGRLSCEARINTVSGAARWHDISAMPVLDDEGEIALWVGTARDVHDEKLRQQALDRANETLCALERYSEGLLYLKDKQGCIVWCNDGVVEVLGLDRKDLLGRLATEYMRGEQDAKHVSVHDRQVVNEGRTLLVEEVLHYPHRVYLSAKAPWRTTSGEVVGLVGISLNITDEQRMRLQWRRAFERHEQVAPIIVSRFDAQLRHLSVTHGVEMVTGLPPTAFVGKSNRELGMPGHLCDAWDRVMQDVLADGQTREIDFTFTGPDAAPRVFRSIVSRDIDDRGGEPTLVAVAHDVTDLKAKQVLVREREARLAAALSVARLQIWTYLVGEDMFVFPAKLRSVHGIGGSGDRVRWVDAFTGIHQDDVERVQRSLRHCAQDGIDYDETYRVRDAEGNHRVVRAAGRLVPRDPSDGSVPHVAGVTFDLTDERRALQLLKESEESLRLAVDAVRAGRYDWNLVTGELKWDDRARTLFHLPEGESPSYEYFLSVLHPEDRVRLAARTGTHLDGARGDGLWSERYRVVQPDGSLRWLEGQGRVTYDDEDELRRPLRFIGLVTDVTERVETLERLAASESALRKSLSALAESEERMRLAMESSSLGWWDLDVTTTHIIWSASARRLHDLPETDDVCLEQALTRVVPEDLPRIRLAIQTAMSPSADGTFHESYRVLWRDGTKREVEAIGRVRFAQCDGKRQATRFSGVVWDVTDERNLWRSLQDKRAYLAALVQTAPVGILSVDERGRISKSNPFMNDLFGVPAREADARSEAGRWESYDAQGARIGIEAYPLIEVLSGADRSETEVLHVAKDGRRMWLRLVAAPVVQQGNRVGAVMVCVDIDAERRAVEGLKEADTRKEQFFAMLAHEIRNPLAAISNAMYMLSREPGLSERATFATGVIGRQSMQLQSLVDDLLEVSRISRDSFTLNKRPTSVTKLVRDASETALLHAQRRAQSLTMTLPLHEVEAAMDAVRMGQVLDNLIGNAIKYTPEGGAIQVALACDSDHLEVSITDNGIGIDRGDLERVFDLFHQQKSQTGHAALGFGIGLAMVKRLVELHEGQVWAESQGLGLGSRFVVRVPITSAVSEKSAVMFEDS